MVVENIISLFWKSVKRSDDKRLRSQAEPEGCNQEINIPYSDLYSPLTLLDVYYPVGTKKTDKLPVVIDIHGGGWYYGDKELNKNYCLAIAARGYCVYNISYRLCPEVKNYQQIQDVMEALQWIKFHIADFPADENRILLTGDSAGGQLAFYAAALCKSEKLRKAFGAIDPLFVPDCVALTSPVAYLYPEKSVLGLNALTVVGREYHICKWGKYLGATEILAETDVPPVFVVTSSGDMIGREPSLKLFREIKATGNHGKLMDWTDYRGKELPHVFSVLYPQDETGVETINTMLDYFNECCEAKK